MPNQARPLNDQPTNQRLLTTEEGKMYDLYILEPNGEIKSLTTDLEDDTLFFDWKDHCINPRAFIYLAKKYDCQITDKTLKHVHREFLENYLDADSVLDVCIEDQLVRVKIQPRGIELYGYRLGIDQTFPTIEELNKFLVEKGSPTYFEFKQDVTQTWQQVMAPVLDTSKRKVHFVKMNQDSTHLQTVTVIESEGGKIDVTSVITPFIELKYLTILNEYYNYYSAITESILDLTIYNTSRNDKDSVITVNSFETQEEAESFIDKKYGIKTFL